MSNDEIKKTNKYRKNQINLTKLKKIKRMLVKSEK
jgi:hypothetical protein